MYIKQVGSKKINNNYIRKGQQKRNGEGTECLLDLSAKKAVSNNNKRGPASDTWSASFKSGM